MPQIATGQKSSPLKGRPHISLLRPPTQDLVPSPVEAVPLRGAAPDRPAPPCRENSPKNSGMGALVNNADSKTGGPPRPHRAGPRRTGYSPPGIKALPSARRWPLGAGGTQTRASCSGRRGTQTQDPYSGRRGYPDLRPLPRPPGALSPAPPAQAAGGTQPRARCSPLRPPGGSHTSSPRLGRANLARTSCSGQGPRGAPDPCLGQAAGTPTPASLPPPRQPGPRPLPRRARHLPPQPAGPAPHSPRARCPSSWCRGREGARRAAGAALRSPSLAIPSPLEIPAIEESPGPHGRRLLRIANPRLGSPQRLLLRVSPQQNGPRKQQPRQPQRPPARHPESDGRGRGGEGGAAGGAGPHTGGGAGLTARARAPRPPAHPPPRRSLPGSHRPRGRKDSGGGGGSRPCRFFNYLLVTLLSALRTTIRL